MCYEWNELKRLAIKKLDPLSSDLHLYFMILDQFVQPLAQKLIEIFSLENSSGHYDYYASSYVVRN